MNIAIALMALLGIGSQAHAQVLGDDTKLVNLTAGDSIEITRPFKIESGQVIHGHGGLFFNDCDLHMKEFPKEAPAEVTLPPGLKLKIVSTSIRDYSRVRKSIIINFDDPFVSSVECKEGYLLAVEHYKYLTVKDLRRALGWNVWVDGHPGEGSRTQLVSAPTTSEDQQKWVWRYEDEAALKARNQALADQIAQRGAR